MVILPTSKQLKKAIHKKIALAQDILVIEVYNHFPKAVIHGGTAIWRCYGSNRFSEDIDFYLPKIARQDLEKFLNDLKNKGFQVKKFKVTERAIFSKFLYIDVGVQLEAVFKTIKNFITKAFELSDGTSIIVNTLRAENLIEEKVISYLQRRKIRDLYDIYFLLRFIEERNVVDNLLKKLMEKFKLPIDENELKALIISGAVPSFENIVEEIKKWVK
ncbi:MAG: nucleotidyl transferase AbiEii/AbiGii toxin family protein [Candidatus Aenigmatarchaeota archaeon]